MMYNLPYLTGKKVVYVGSSREKSSLEEFLIELGGIQGFSVIKAKTRDETIAKLKEIDPADTVFIKSRNIPGYLMPYKYTTTTRIFFDCSKQLGVKSVGVIGTKGKTTTASLLTHILKDAGLDARLCGSEGTPMLQALKSTTSETVLIVELSSYQLVELEQSPDVAVIVNLYKDRVDYHGSQELYLEAQRNAIRFMHENCAVIYQPDSEVVKEWLANSPVRQMPIDPQENVDMSKTKLFGEHNEQNYLMAKKAASLFGVSGMNCMSSLATFEPVRHRLQIVRSTRDITFVDDAIGSTPEATVAGIKAIIKNKGPVGCVMLGGVDQQYDFTELVELLYRVDVPSLVFFPDTGPIIENLLPENYTPEKFNATDMEEAVQWAFEHTPSGSICLLSTASPSTVLWHSFEEKGSLFQQAVLALPN